jgi:hypothetical protein
MGIKKKTCKLKNPQVFITYANFRVIVKTSTV